MSTERKAAARTAVKALKEWIEDVGVFGLAALFLAAVIVNAFKQALVPTLVACFLFGVIVRSAIYTAREMLRRPCGMPSCELRKGHTGPHMAHREIEEES